MECVLFLLIKLPGDGWRHLLLWSIILLQDVLFLSFPGVEICIVRSVQPFESVDEIVKVRPVQG